MFPTSSISKLLFVAALSPSLAYAADVDLTKPPPKAEARTPVKFSDGPTERVVEFALWQTDLMPNDVVGRIDTGLFCSAGSPLRYTKNLDQFLTNQLSRAFKERAVELGLSAPDTTKSVFDSKGGAAADFRVGATLLALDYRACGGQEYKGDTYAKLKWELFSTRRQKVVYSSIIGASYSTSKSIAEKDFDKAVMQSIVDNLLGDPRFVEVIRSGGALDDVPTKALAAMQIRPGPVVVGGVTKTVGELRPAVVTVESGIGSGSAFFISQDGYLLTNSHVVGDAKFVRIRLSGGRSAVGELVRVDKQRDVALLRTDPVTFGVLALRREPAKAGEEVYALGSPYGEALSGTLTRGVLSAARVIDGVAYLQSDAAINPGNSGGPLLDAQGQVIGVAQIGTSAKGISLFIPINETLEKLALEVDGPRGAAQAFPQ